MSTAPARLPVAITAGIVAALVIGFLAAWVDLHSVEVLPSVTLIVAGGIVLGFALPRYAWALGAIAGAAIPTAHIAARILRYPVPYPVVLPFTVLAVVLGIIAGLIGGKIRPVLEALMRKP